MRNVQGFSLWAKGNRKARRELEQALGVDEDNHATRFALVRLLAFTGEYLAADELLRGPGIEEKLLADPTTRVAMLSSLGDAYLNIWQARWERAPGDGKTRGTRTDTERGFESRLDVSAERTELLHQAQRFFEDALATPENLNDPVIRAQVAFCKEARGDCKDALSLYASIIADSPLSPGASAVIFRTSVLLAHVGRYDECVRYLEYIEGNLPKGCSRLLIESMLYTCYVAMGLQIKASRRVLTLREAFRREHQEGRIGVGFSREEIPWDRLPGWFHLWRELGEQSMRKGDYYLGVHLLSQATSRKEDPETLVRTGEMLWVLRDAKHALELCERAYVADPFHAGAKRRLSAWAPEKWRDTITKEEERRAAIAEMQRLSELSGKKADAMIARRARREKARALHGWQRLHAKCMNHRKRIQAEEGRVTAAAAAATLERGRWNQESRSTRSNSSHGSPPSSGLYHSSSGSSGSSVSHSSRSSSSLSVLSTTLSSSSEIHSLGASNKEAIAAVRTPSPARAKRTFPVPSAAEAARAGRANAAACFRAELKRTGLDNTKKESGGGRRVAMASVAVAAGRVREALSGGSGVRDFHTPEMRALARFESARKTHEGESWRNSSRVLQFYSVVSLQQCRRWEGGTVKRQGMDDRKTLIAAVAEAAAEGNNDSESKYKGLLAFVKRHFSRGDDLNLGEVLQTMGKKDHQKLWTRLMEVVTPIIEEERFMMVKSKHDANGEDSDAPPAGADEDLPKEGPMNDTGDTPERRTPSERESPKCRPRRDGEKTRKEAGVSVALEVLHATAVLAQEFLSDKERVAPRALLETAAFLHGIILSLQGLQGTVLQGVIAKVCEMWWTQERPGGEHLVTQLLPLMLVRSLDEHAKEADVKRVFGMRTALLLLDFDDESSDSLRALLLRSFISPLYLKSSEGKRLLAYLFGLHQSLVLDIHAVIKAQIPGAKRAVLAAYGEIYFRVWRGAEGPYLEKVETHCLQELMHACIHASTPKMHASLLVVLDGVHSQKKTKGMDAALLRLYGPVLWRALRVANPTVRAQACQVLVDAFPLQDPSAGAAAYEAVLLQQFDAFAALLEDGHPRVRAVAAKGVCQVLSVYWETFPVATTRALLSRVVGRLASDGTSAMVRLGAVEGLVTLLLDCPASHGVLKAMLPGVSRLIHDNNKRVRVAFVKLLRLVKGMRSIKYYHVVPVDHILARLAEDHLSCPASASGLTELILNSYFPTGLGITGSLQVSRCLTLLSQDEPAATAFYGRLHQHAGVPSAAKVLAMLVRCAVVAARKSADEGDGIMPPQKEGASRKSGKRKGLEAEGGVSGKGGGERRTLKASDSKAMSGVLNLIATIWESLLPSLEESVNEPSLQLIQETFTGEALAVLHRRFFRDEGCRSAFMRVAGLAGLGLTPGMLEEVVLEMLAMPADATPRLYGPTVELLCSWGQEEHLIGAIVNSLQRSFSTATFTEDLDNASAEETVSRGKRPRPVRGGRDGRGDGIDRNSDDGYDETGLHPSLALSMLNHLLAGGNGHAPTLAARDSIIFDDIASHALESTLSLARERADARLCAVSGRPASVVAEVSKGNERRFRRCPDAILVRAVEALGRVFMHREAALVGDLHGGVYASRVNGETQQGKAGEEEEAILRPMPFSVKMRELMVWTTNTVLPALAGLSGDVADGMAAATPVKPAAVPGAMSIESPSPLPPPRAKARGAEGEELVSVDAPASSVSAPSNSTVTAVTEDMGLAEGLLGTVVLLAAEWVEVGSGLAEVSMRADTWGDRLLDLLLQQDEACFERVVAVLPQLCRLGLKLSGREAQGARPSASMCEVLLRCADCCLAEEEEGCTKGMRSSTPVQRYLAAAVALQGKRGDLSPLMERLLGFAFTQASAVYVEDCEHDIRGEVSRSTDIDDLVRLRVPPYGTAVASEGAVVSSSDDACFLLELSRPAAAVLALVLRSTPASNAAGSLVLAHLGIFRPGDAGTDAAWPLFCAHVLGALIDHAPAKARLEIAAEAHLALKGATAAAAAAATAGASLMTEDNVSAYVNGEGKLEGEREIDTKKATIFAVRAIYGRLEAARRAAAIVGMDVGGDKGVPEAQACAVVGEDSVVMVPV